MTFSTYWKLEEISFDGHHLGVAGEGGGVVRVCVLQVSRRLQYVRILGEPELIMLKKCSLCPLNESTSL